MVTVDQLTVMVFGVPDAKTAIIWTLLILPRVTIANLAHHLVCHVMDMRIVLSAIPVAMDIFVNRSIVLDAKIIYATKIRDPV